MKKTATILFYSMLAVGMFQNAPTFGQSGFAGMPGVYLHMGVGARALGMGKAYTAVANDATALYWNPAGLANQNPYQFAFMHETLFFDTALDFLAATAPTERFGSFGLGVIALSSGGFEQRSLLNEELGNFEMRDMAFLFSWSKQVLGDWAVGINYKLVSQKILNFSGIGHGLDLGIKTRLFDRLDVGVVLANLLSPRVTLVAVPEKYPMQFRAGLASAFIDDKLIISADLSKISGWGTTHVNFGGEYRVLRGAAIRAGLDNGALTIGAGYSFNQYGFDYSNASAADLGTSHRFSVSYAVGGFGVEAEALPKIFSPAGEVNISHIRLGVKSRTPVSQWLLAIVDAQGRIVRQFAANGATPDEIAWDGRDDRGALVADGAFTYRFEVMTVDGKSMNAAGMLVKIDSHGPIGVVGSIEDK